MKYPKGNPVPNNVIEALKLTGKIGFISRALWLHHYAKGEARWGRRQLDKLTNCHRLVVPHPNPAAKDCYVLSRRGCAFLERLNSPAIMNVPVAQIAHDEFIADSLIRLEQSGIVQNWQTEAEMKSGSVKAYLLNQDPRNKKYPDVIFKIAVQNKEWTMAVEYERTRKAAIRYKDILWLYSRMTNIKLLLFICDSPIIESTIRGQMKKMRMPALFGRVAFVQADDWQNNPETATVELEGKTFSLSSFCSRLNHKPSTAMAR